MALLKEKISHLRGQDSHRVFYKDLFSGTESCLGYELNRLVYSWVPPGLLPRHPQPHFPSYASWLKLRPPQSLDVEGWCLFVFWFIISLSCSSSRFPPALCSLWEGLSSSPLQQRLTQRGGAALNPPSCRSSPELAVLASSMSVAAVPY